MRLSHKRKVAAKKAGMIPRLKRLPRRFASDSVMQLKPGEKVVCFIGSRQRVSKSSMIDQAMMDSWLRSGEKKITVISSADSSAFQRGLEKVRKAFRDLCPGNLSGLFNARHRSA